ncbi:putative chitinase [Ophiocordyceps camponoti-saundersi (nom. inval.)]|nr:putative chitinase [Ophiocordyceps camponoti-saundersi (nom. inval.)]
MPSLFSSFTCGAGLLAIVSSAPTLIHSGGGGGGGGQNLAIYWGQNSYGQGSGPNVQKNLAFYCENTNINIIPLAFMNGITPPIVNFANAGDRCETFNGTGLLKCPEIEADIQTCQTKYKKTIVVSLGGATYTQGGWSSPAEAAKAADMVWAMFGPVPADGNSTVQRPFGAAVVDGFDFDFEAVTNNLPAFGARLRTLMDTASDYAPKKHFYLTAAPQCVFPDAAVGSTLDAVPFDYVFIQFYNNWCGVSNFQPGAATQPAFNMDVWDSWSKRSKNPAVKVLLGIPANYGAGGGYVRGPKLTSVIQYSRQFPSFGGVMMWDMSQLYANPGFLEEVVAALS